MFNSIPTSSQSSTLHPSQIYDPAFVKLPIDNGNNLLDGPTVAQAIRTAPTQIIRGIRQKTKSKDKGSTVVDNQNLLIL